MRVLWCLSSSQAIINDLQIFGLRDRIEIEINNY